MIAIIDYDNLTIIFAINLKKGNYNTIKMD